jgi:plastocyanin
MKKILTAIATSFLLIGAGCAATAPAPAPAPAPTPAAETAPEAAPSTEIQVETAPMPVPEAPTTPETEAKTAPTSAVPAVPTAQAAAPASSVKAFTVTGNNFAFDLKEMKVKKGDRVRVTFKNAEGFHDWRLDEFTAATQKLQAAQEETVEFVADKAGTFEYYCSVGKHRAMGMKGNLIVE